MSDQTAEQSQEDGEQPQEDGEQQQEQPKTFDAEYVEKIRKEAAQHRTEKNALVKELENHRKASMTEAEKASVEAEQRGRQAATADFGKRLARTEFDALAGRRNPAVDTAQLLEFVDLARFVGEDGEPDSKAIAAAVERLVPAPAATTPSFDGGVRTPAPPSSSMTDLIRRQAGRT